MLALKHVSYSSKHNIKKQIILLKHENEQKTETEQTFMTQHVHLWTLCYKTKSTNQPMVSYLKVKYPSNCLKFQRVRVMLALNINPIQVNII